MEETKTRGFYLPEFLKLEDNLRVVEIFQEIVGKQGFFSKEVKHLVLSEE